MGPNEARILKLSDGIEVELNRYGLRITDDDYPRNTIEIDTQDINRLVDWLVARIIEGDIS